MLRYQSTKQNQEDKKNSLIKNIYLDLTYKLTIFNLDNSVRNNRREPPPPPPIQVQSLWSITPN